MQNIELLGILAGLITTISFFPQALRIWKTHNTQGISLGMYMFYFLGLILWSIYAWVIKAPALLITELVSSILVGYILFQKFRETEIQSS